MTLTAAGRARHTDQYKVFEKAVYHYIPGMTTSCNFLSVKKIAKPFESIAVGIWKA